MDKYSNHSTKSQCATRWKSFEAITRRMLGARGAQGEFADMLKSKLTDEQLPGTNVKRFRRYPEVITAMKNATPRPLFEGEERWETSITSTESICAVAYHPSSFALVASITVRNHTTGARPSARDRWHFADRSSLRGRGLAIVTSLADEVTVDDDAGDVVVTARIRCQLS